MPTAVADEETKRPLVTSREPVGPVNAGDPGSQADQALRDALIVLVAAWVILFLLAFSLRRYNI